MGRSTADGLTCNDDGVALLGDFIDQVVEAALEGIFAGLGGRRVGHVLAADRDRGGTT
jgi:hypothetical protein